MKSEDQFKKFSDEMKKNADKVTKIKTESFKRRLLIASKRLGFDFTKSLN